MKSPTVAELGVRDLQLRLLPSDDEPVLAPVELKGLARRKYERHISAAACLMGTFPLTLSPVAGEGRDTIVGSVEPERDQIPVQLFQITASFAVALRLAQQPA
jgi:hypothetical protein